MKNLYLIYLMINLLSISVFAQWSSDPAENSPISLASGEQALPLVATSENGTSYIAWFSNETGNYNVMLQKLDVFGNFQWDSAGLLISDHEAMSYLTDWDMTIDQEDFAILTFQDVRNEYNNIYAYRISPEGEFIWGDDGLALSNSSAFDASPKVAVTNAGNAVFAWQADEVVIIQKVSSEGEKQWGEDGITLSGSSTFSWPQLLAVGEDDIILKYFEDTGQFPAITRHVYAQRFDTDGNPAWDDVTIISDAGGITGFTNIFSFIKDGADGFYIAWHDERNFPQPPSIFVQHIGSDGSVLFVDDGLEATTNVSMNHYYAKLALPPGSDDIFVYWRATNSAQSNWGIYGQKLSSTGQRLWTDNGKSFIDLSATNVDLIAARNSSEDMVVFYEESTSGINAIIKAMRIDTDGNYVWEDEKINMCTVPSEKVHSVAGSFYNDQWIATWEDSRNGGKDIYAQNIQLNGTLGPITFPTELTVTPDTLFCEEIDENYVYIINNTMNDVMINDFYFEFGWYVYFEDMPALPHNLGVNDSIVLDVWVIPGSDYYNPNGYEYDILFIESEIGNYSVDIAINWDLLGAIDESNKNNKVLSIAPIPAKDFVTFSLQSEQGLEYELVIYDSFGKKINSFIPENKTSIIWDLTDYSGQKVPPGTYIYRLNSDTNQESGKIILIE